jgi:hypothetical protein
MHHVRVEGGFFQYESWFLIQYPVVSLVYTTTLVCQTLFG